MANKPFPFSVCKECCGVSGITEEQMRQITEEVEKNITSVSHADKANQANVADKASKDSDGNKINEHYATKEEIGDRSKLMDAPNDDLVTAINRAFNNFETTKIIADTAFKDAQTAIDRSVSALQIAKGANQSKTFADYLAVITTLNGAEANVYNAGQNLYVITKDVPDLWISENVDTAQFYTYSTDEAFIEDLVTNGKVTVGWYAVSMLETQKVDLTEYASKKSVEDIVSGKTHVGFAYKAFYDNYGNDIHQYYASKDNLGVAIDALTNQLTSGSLIVNTAQNSAKAETDWNNNVIHTTYATKAEVGDIETALDNIIAIQNTLIGGGSV